MQRMADINAEDGSAKEDSGNVDGEEAKHQQMFFDIQVMSAIDNGMNGEMKKVIMQQNIIRTVKKCGKNEENC